LPPEINAPILPTELISRPDKIFYGPGEDPVELQGRQYERPAGSDTRKIICPSGYVPRLVNGVWTCVKLYSGITEVTYGGKAPPGGG
jgi:hypothetical protein